MVTLTLLGTGTCQLEPHRAATSALVEFPDLRVLFDIGRGVTTRLAERALVSDDIEHIVISHFHPDHISDLIPFLQDACWSTRAPRTKELYLYGPIGLKAQAMRLMSAFGPHDLLRPTFNVHLREIDTTHFRIGERDFQFVDFPPANNHGLKFAVEGKWFVLTGDAYYTPELINGLTHVSLAVIDSGHPTDPEIVDLAVKTQCQTIVCSHLYRSLDIEALQAQAVARGYTGRLVLAEDRMQFRLPVS